MHKKMLHIYYTAIINTGTLLSSIEVASPLYRFWDKRNTIYPKKTTSIYFTIFLVLTIFSISKLNYYFQEDIGIQTDNKLVRVHVYDLGSPREVQLRPTRLN